MSENMRERPKDFVNTGRLLIRLFRKFEEEIVASLSRRGFSDVTLANLSVLRHLDLDGLRITTLAEDAGVTKQAVGQMIVELESKGYVKKRRDPNDRRAKLVTYTERGMELIKTAQAIVSEIEVSYRQELGSKSYEALRHGLKTLLEASDDSPMVQTPDH